MEYDPEAVVDFSAVAEYYDRTASLNVKDSWEWHTAEVVEVNSGSPTYCTVQMKNVLQEALWLQPTDQLRSFPQKPRQENLHLHNSKGSGRGNRRELRSGAHRPRYRDIKVLSSDEKALFEECAYCKGVGRPFVGHAKTACPVLFAMRPCSLCGADGYDNHTRSHCPSQQKVILALKEDYRYGAEIRQAKRCALI